MKTYFTADPHFDHEKLMDITARPFPDVQTWNELFMDAINSLVGRSDRLIILGDFGFSKRIGYFKQQINCRHVELVIGNHDQESKCRPHFGGAIWHQRTIKFFDTKLYMSHYPHCYWDHSHRNSMHIYGHMHNQREAYLNTIWPDRRSMDVSPDTAFALFGEWRPFADDEIYGILSSRKGHDQMEFYYEYQRQLAEKRQCSSE